MKIFHILISSLLIAPCGTQADLLPSCDVLFPVFWYEKAVRATMRAFYIIQSIHGGKVADNDYVTSCTLAMGDILFASFCISEIDHTQCTECYEDDMAYFCRLLTKVDAMIGEIVHIKVVSDQIRCMRSTVQNMYNRLQIETNV